MLNLEEFFYSYGKILWISRSKHYSKLGHLTEGLKSKVNQFYNIRINFIILVHPKFLKSVKKKRYLMTFSTLYINKNNRNQIILWVVDLLIIIAVAA